MKSEAMDKGSLLHRAVVVSALGYFVDIYDLILFSVVRKQSLIDIGIPESRILQVGINLIDLQMIGMLIGGIIWGVLGDKRGRVSVLYGSILLYSLANLLNAFVYDATSYGVLRFVAGIGLAGELGAAITLVSEVLGQKLRGAAAGIVAGFGLMGAVAAVIVGETLNWRWAYGIGGVMGLVLLMIRLKTGESEIFARVSASKPETRGAFFSFFTSPERLKRYLSCVGLGVPVWLVVGILATLALSVSHLTIGAQSSFIFYSTLTLLGVAVGYWALFVLTTAETFGTNLRANATTTVPNFVRASLVPLNFIVSRFAAEGKILTGAWVALVVAFGCSLVALKVLKETHGRDLDFLEEEDVAHEKAFST